MFLGRPVHTTVAAACHARPPGEGRALHKRFPFAQVAAPRPQQVLQQWLLCAFLHTFTHNNQN
jgi:hypothetical protein